MNTTHSEANTNPDISGDLEELAKAINLQRLLKSIQQNPDLPGVIDSLVSDFEDTDDPNDTEAPPVNSVMRRRNTNMDRRFSLDSLPPYVAAVMSAFDFDKNGKVTLEEVQKGAELLQAEKKQKKAALYALAIQFVVYFVLTGLSAGLLYHFISILQETTVDATTGSLMVRTNDPHIPDDLQVSVKSHGKTFSHDFEMTDPDTGEEKKCILSSTAKEMFEEATRGTPTTFMEQDSASGVIKVTNIGIEGGIAWADEEVRMGGLTFVPDMACTRKYQDSNDDEHNRSRTLTEESLYDAHMELRDQVAITLMDGSSHDMQERHLNSNVDGGVLYIKQDIPIRGVEVLGGAAICSIELAQVIMTELCDNYRETPGVYPPFELYFAGKNYEVDYQLHYSCSLKNDIWHSPGLTTVRIKEKNGPLVCYFNRSQPGGVKHCNMLTP